MSANLQDSIRARLNAANEIHGWDPNETLVRYGTEGFLRRLAGRGNPGGADAGVSGSPGAAVALARLSEAQSA